MPVEAVASTEQLYHDNLRLSQREYEERQTFLYSRPRCLGLVLGNACNIDCVHCYQSKSGANLLRPPEIARQLRSELRGFYPYASTVRIQGGEVFALRGFEDLVDDVANAVNRPILSISTNGTLIDEKWAEKLVRMRFANVTVSIDGGTRATYNRLRKGADLEQVLANVDRIQRWKKKLDTPLPYLDSFFVVMRSNFREIPQYLDLMRRHGIADVSLQTMELSPENTKRHPALGAEESLSDPQEVNELHGILRNTIPTFDGSFRMIRVSGLQTLFETHGLPAAFLSEDRKGLYPNSEGLADGGFELCPNPWTTLFLVENGDVHLCFISQPIGNLYSEPLAALWNSPNAMAKRSRMISGRYVGSGCSRQYCGWREGRASPGRNPANAGSESPELLQIRGLSYAGEADAGVLTLVRRLLADESRRRREVEARNHLLESDSEESQKHIAHLEGKVQGLQSLVRDLEAQLETRLAHIDHLAAEARESAALLGAGQKHIDHLEAKAQDAIGRMRDIENEFATYRSSWLVRAAHRASTLLSR